MRLLQTIGRILLASAIFRSMRGAPKWLLGAAALVGIALMSIGTARAATWPTQDKAYSECQLDITNAKKNSGASAANFTCTHHPANPPNPPLPGYQCRWTLNSESGNCHIWGNGARSEIHYYQQPCPADAPFDPTTGTCRAPKNCATRPNYGGAMVSGASEFCHDGCAYTNAAEVSVCLGEGAAMVCPGASWKPTGAECSSGPAPMPYDTSRDTCERKPGASHSQCVKPSGETCVTSAKGNRFCWSPGESGDRMTADGSEGATKGQGTQQQSPPSSMTDPQSQGTSTTTTTTNNATTVHSTTVFSGSGNTGGQSNVGPGGRDVGSGQGEGDGDGDGNGVSGGGSCAAPPTNCVGDAHTCKLIEQAWLQRCDGKGEGDTIANRAAQFEGEINQLGEDDGPSQADMDAVLNKDPFEGVKILQDGSGLLDRLDASGFLGSGSCPTLESVTVGTVTVPLTLGPLCQLLANMSYLVLALAYFISVRIVAGGV